MLRDLWIILKKTSITTCQSSKLDLGGLLGRCRNWLLWGKKPLCTTEMSFRRNEHYYLKLIAQNVKNKLLEYFNC